MVTEDKSRDGKRTKGTKSVPQKSSAAATAGHREGAQRTARLYEDKGKVIYEECTGEASGTGKQGCENGKEGRQGTTLTRRAADVASNGTVTLASLQGELICEEAGLEATGDPRVQGTVGQAWSGPDDDMTEEPDLTSVDKSSSLSFLDWQNRDDSDMQTSTLAVEVEVKTEVVLIDEDDDMSLREKTVTDVSLMDGNAAELVCGRLMSISSDSISECKEESLPIETPLPPPPVAVKKRHPCCCAII